MAPATIVAVTGDEERKHVLDRAQALANERQATVILFDRDADLGPLQSPLPTDWSADGEEEQFSDRLDPGDLERAGQAALGRQVQRLRDAGVDAYGWLPSTADAKSLTEYAAKQHADVVLLSVADEDLARGGSDGQPGAATIEMVPGE